MADWVWGWGQEWREDNKLNMEGTICFSLHFTSLHFLLRVSLHFSLLLLVSLQGLLVFRIEAHHKRGALQLQFQFLGVLDAFGDVCRGVPLCPPLRPIGTHTSSVPSSAFNHQSNITQVWSNSYATQSKMKKCTSQQYAFSMCKNTSQVQCRQITVLFKLTDERC
jgi:hypothetical protein